MESPEWTIGGVRVGMARADLLKKLGRPRQTLWLPSQAASVPFQTLEFAHVRVTLSELDVVLQVEGDSLAWADQTVSADYPRWEVTARLGPPDGAVDEAKRVDDGATQLYRRGNQVLYVRYQGERVKQFVIFNSPPSSEPGGYALIGCVAVSSSEPVFHQLQPRVLGTEGWTLEGVCPGMSAQQVRARLGQASQERHRPRGVALIIRFSHGDVALSVQSCRTLELGERVVARAGDEKTWVRRELGPPDVTLEGRGTVDVYDGGLHQLRISYSQDLVCRFTLELAKGALPGPPWTDDPGQPGSGLPRRPGPRDRSGSGQRLPENSV